ncbi:MAG: DUF3570 domain-containing protein [Taibaiella sp.]|jgi:hypothetical protein
MKRIFLSAAGILAFLHSIAQQKGEVDTGFRSRKLKVEEVDFISSYYKQDGNNASVTGGIGSEKLTDIANIIDVTLSKYDKKFRKHTFGIEAGLDNYTSASSDMIDLQANSSASHGDKRIYPSLSWSMENEQKGYTIGAALSLSTEYDYKSYGGNIFFSQKTKNRNGEFTAKLQVYLDQVKLVTPVELRPGYNGQSKDEQYETSARNTIAGSLSYLQIVNQRLQIMFIADLIQQQGYLSLPFHRVYFADGSVHQENMPDNRLKVPLGIRANYFIGDRFIVRAYYRFYTDNWGVTAHTADIELPVKITPFLSVSPFYRYYTQTASKYFAPYKEHTAQDEYYISNYDLSKFNSNFFGTGIRYAPPKGVLGIAAFNMVELRYGHYTRSTSLNLDIISLNIKFK